MRAPVFEVTTHSYERFCLQQEVLSVVLQCYELTVTWYFREFWNKSERAHSRIWWLNSRESSKPKLPDDEIGLLNGTDHLDRTSLDEVQVSGFGYVLFRSEYGMNETGGAISRGWRMEENLPGVCTRDI
jgi:hypothetical protein